MANTNIDILLRLNDKFSSPMAKAQTQMAQFAKEVEKTSRTMNQIGSNIQRMGQSMMWAGGVITGAFGLALNNARKYSLEVDYAMDQLSQTVTNFQIQLATTVIPYVNQFVNWLKSLLEAFRSLDPKVQQTIISVTFLTGAWLLLGGTVMNSIGALIKFGASLLKIGGMFLGVLATMNPVVVGIVAGVAVIITALGQWQNVMLGLVQTFDYVFSIIGMGFEQLKMGFAIFVDGFVIQLQAIVDALSKIPSPWQTKLRDWSGALKKLSSDLRSVASDSRQSANQFGMNLQNMMSGQSGNMVNGVQQFTANWENFFKSFKDKMNNTKGAVVNWGETVKTTMRNVAQSISQAFGNALFDGISNRFRGLGDIVRNLGDTIMQMLAQMVAKIAIVTALNAVGLGGLGMLFMHTGGMVKPLYAHTGLAPDEVPIVAQTGEGVLSRRGMSAIGGSDRLRRINQGEGIGGDGGQTVIINQVIKAWDASDVYRNRKVISSALANEIRNNGNLRKAIKEG